MKIGIIGGGSIGLLIASYLAKQKHTITIYVKRNRQKNLINNNGITLLPNKQVLKVRALLISELEEEEVLFVCVKQYDLDQLWDCLSAAKSPLIFTQNGMSHIDKVRAYVEKQEVMLATVEHGAKRLHDDTVKHTGHGLIRIALLDEPCNSLSLDRLVKQIKAEEFPIQVMADWYLMLANKLVVNAVINPLTAIFQVKNGAIIQNPYLYRLGKQMVKEATSVLGLNSDDMWDKILLVAKNTKNNDSSMKVDVKNNRKTEIDGILGYLIMKAEIPVPYITFAYDSIKALEMGFEESLE